MHVSPSTPDQPELNPHPAPTDLRVGEPGATPRRRSASATSRFSAALRRQLVERPWLTLGVAAAAGFAIGGGVTSPALHGLVRLGTRLAVAVASREFATVIAAPAPTSLGSA